MPNTPDVALNDGNTLPALGFGVYKVADSDAVDAVAGALTAGYRSIDTAAYYKNERGTGEAIRSSGIPRDNLRVTTKVWHTELGYDLTRQSVTQSLKTLGLDYLDLVLIHWPVPSRNLYLDSWQALIDAQRDGLTRSIGVSNFNRPELERLISQTGVVPAVNQIELNPWLPQAELRKFHSEAGIATAAWSPLGNGRLLDDPTVKEIAAKHERTPAQVLLRWNLDLGTIVLTKSLHPDRARSNLDVFSFTLTDADRTSLARLESGQRTGPDPDVYGKP